MITGAIAVDDPHQPQSKNHVHLQSHNPPITLDISSKTSRASSADSFKLGDFARIFTSATACSSTPLLKRPVQLGNFAKIHEQFTRAQPSTSRPDSQSARSPAPYVFTSQPTEGTPSFKFSFASSSAKSLPLAKPKLQDSQTVSQPPLFKFTSKPIQGAASFNFSFFSSPLPKEYARSEARPLAGDSLPTRPSDRSGRADGDVLTIFSLLDIEASKERSQRPENISLADKDITRVQAAWTAAETAGYSRQPQPHGTILSYRRSRNGKLVEVVGEMLATVHKHELLSYKLGPQLQLDSALRKARPQTTRNGIHVFLDMSNINISFHNTLREIYNIHEKATFQPLPLLKLDFLTEIFVRGRKVVTQNAGCSTKPTQRQPPYIQDLRKLGYQVDLRPRIAVSGRRRNRANHHYYSPCDSSTDTDDDVIRYVEDMVDETLQTRIAEAVMEYFETPGTLVLGTGDAQPASYSDGFFTYAERALKMGWDVEVVSWKQSLSSRWQDRGWISRWGDHFRIIELDTFIETLLVT